ncbi:MAG: CHAT domain-containing tetratricopeptide repeat protein [Hyalangium sp.]|uniref:CHAT domain-containing tetratricopeptide repeat protein n=1 Tax=Hyalangium sp. TaxID=2028555 RepID=UPI00389AF773
MQVLKWMLVGMLCCGAAAADEGRLDARLQQAQAAYDAATKLQQEGRYAEALVQGEQALALREAVLGSTHPQVASCLHLLGTLHQLRGDYEQAEPPLQRALQLRDAPVSDDPLALADSLSSLANLYTEQGFFGRAMPLYQRALGIREATLGENHPDVADSLNGMARLDAKLGAYSRAEPLYQRALAIREAALGSNHPLVATSLNNLANLYREQGSYGRAEPLYQRALAIREAALGSHHPLVATSLDNLANLYRDQGLYGRGQPLGERALAINEAALGPKHPDVARTLDILASLYADQGLYSRAEPLFRRALAIRQAALGNHHPDVAYSLTSLAGLYKAQGFYARAEPLYEQALSIREAALGPSHALVAEALNNLGQLRLAQQRMEEALPLLQRAFTISEQRLRHEALDFSESRLDSFLQFLRGDEEQLYTLLRAHPDNAQVQRLALTAVLLLKGRSVEEAADTSRTIYQSLGAQDRGTFERLRDLRTQLSSLALQDPGALAATDYQSRLKQLDAQGDALETDLARRSAPLRALTALPSPSEVVDRVAAALPKDSALVEFVSYRERPLLRPPGAPEASQPGQLRYLALVLFPDARIRASDLGPAEPMELAASRLRDALARRDATFQASAQALYQMAFRPLEPLLGGTHRLFLSPDGQLGLVPFAALHDGSQFLVDTYDFTYLTAGKDLLFRTQDRALSGSVVVLADPDFRARLPEPQATRGGAQEWDEPPPSLERFFSTLRADVVERAWAPLPGTRQEAEAIQRLIPQAQLFLGPEATKERLLRLPSPPGVLHLATHGFFLGDAPAPEDSRGVGHFGALADENLAPRSANPLLRSGLVLAGARAPGPQSSGAERPQLDSALVTALELAGLDLWGTQLVVLSACDTGRGEVKLGQGVYGLRRALVVAGAETVVMSLWKVNDKTTRELMEAYYRNLLAGQGRAAALREAMRTLRQTQPHPHYWAPFIALGSDAPLHLFKPGLQSALGEAGAARPAPR